MLSATTLKKAGLLGLAVINLTSAQTFSDCNPVEGDTCPPNPAFGDQDVTIDFTNGAASDIFTPLDATHVTYDPTNGAVFTISDYNDYPTFVSTKYLFFGRVSVVLQAAPGQGIVTSFLLQSDDLDEIDWEWIGSKPAECQSNYFGKGDTSTYDRGAFHGVDDTTGRFHEYAIEWNQEETQWIIDGSVVRTLRYADAAGGTRYPQTPMQVRLGTWVGGRPSNSEGTIEWAGGLADMSQAPFKGYYKSISITDYAGGVSNAKEYVWGDNSGSWESIKVVIGEDGDGDDEDEDDTATTTEHTEDSTTTMTKPTTTTDSEDEDGTTTTEEPESTTTSGEDEEESSTTATEDETSTSTTDGGDAPLQTEEVVNPDSGVSPLKTNSFLAAAAAVAFGVFVI